MSDPPPPLPATCDQLRDQLRDLREALKAAVLQGEAPLSPEAAEAYNAVLFHLQSAREELRKVAK